MLDFVLLWLSVTWLPGAVVFGLILLHRVLRVVICCSSFGVLMFLAICVFGFGGFGVDWLF